MSTCSACGASYEDNFRFCPHCGRAKPEPESINLNMRAAPIRYEEAVLKEDIVPSTTAPHLNEVREFAAKLHSMRKAWAGKALGGPAEYNPERPEPPLDSKMTFTPADFCIRESGIWFFSLM